MCLWLQTRGRTGKDSKPCCKQRNSKNCECMTTQGKHRGLSPSTSSEPSFLNIPKAEWTSSKNNLFS